MASRKCVPRGEGLQGREEKMVFSEKRKAIVGRITAPHISSVEKCRIIKSGGEGETHT